MDREHYEKEFDQEVSKGNEPLYKTFYGVIKNIFKESMKALSRDSYLSFPRNLKEFFTRQTVCSEKDPYYSTQETLREAFEDLGSDDVLIGMGVEQKRKIKSLNKILERGKFPEGNYLEGISKEKLVWESVYAELKNSYVSRRMN